MEQPFLTSPEIRQLVGEGAFERGRAYARSGMVRQVRWNPAGRLLTAIVDGSGPRPYRSQVAFSATKAVWASSCSCPMGLDCKHIAALLLVASAPDNDPVTVTAAATTSATRTPEAARSWRTLVPATPDRGAALALGVELRRRERRTAARWSSAEARSVTRSAVSIAFGDLHVGLRPLVQSATTRRWIKGNISWEAVRQQRGGFRRDHLKWLRDLQAIAASSRPTWSPLDSAEWIVLDTIESPLLWRHLREAAGLKIPLVALSSSVDVRIVDTADVRLAVDPDTNGGSGALRVSAKVTFEGVDHEPAPPKATGAARHLIGVRPVGESGVYEFDIHRRGVSLTLAEVSLNPAVRSLLQGGPIVVPSSERAEFVASALTPLARRITVSAGDGVHLPPSQPPRVRLHTRFERGDKAQFALRWMYPEGTEYPYAHDGAAVRDEPFETRVRERLEQAWEDSSALPFTTAGEWTGADTAVFSAQTLPALDALAAVDVVITGERPDYRALEGVPEITVSTVETTDADWFELGVLVTVGGRVIPFAPLFTALALRQKRILLSDGAYFSLAHPALDRLRDLIAEAADLPEWEVGPRISRYQSALWSEFEDLADYAVPAVAWREHAEGLRDLEHIPQTPVPATVHATLRHYQESGFSWLAFLWSHRMGGVLADDMGLGKTLQMLALVCHATASGSGPFLVVAPTSVLTTWRSEALRFAPGLDVRVIDSTAARRGQSFADAIVGADLVITSYTLLRLDTADFSSVTWDGVILDEAQFVKNPATKLYRAVRDLDARSVFAVTGTPMENSLTDLWALLSLTSPGLFASAAKFRQEYTAPIEQAKVPDVLGAHVEPEEFRRDRLARLRRRIRPLMLRRTKQDVAPELPPKQEQTLRIELAPAHRAHYDRVLQRERQKVLGLLGDLDRNRFIVFRSLTLLRMLSLAPVLVDPTRGGMGSAKLDALLERLEETAAEGHRSLVFSQFTSFLKLAADRLEAAGIAYVYLDGSTRRRAEVIESFRAGDAPVFLISLKAGGFGLTLTEADYVFLLDPWWNPAAEAQAVDRTHRIGQQQTVMVYRMIATGTIEEKVLALQERKAKLFQAVVDDDALFSTALTADDIRGLFEG